MCACNPSCMIFVSTMLNCFFVSLYYWKILYYFIDDSSHIVWNFCSLSWKCSPGRIRHAAVAFPAAAAHSSRKDLSVKWPTFVFCGIWIWSPMRRGNFNSFSNIKFHIPKWLARLTIDFDCEGTAMLFRCLPTLVYLFLSSFCTWSWSNQPLHNWLKASAASSTRWRGGNTFGKVRWLTGNARHGSAAARKSISMRQASYSLSDSVRESLKDKWVSKHFIRSSVAHELKNP